MESIHVGNCPVCNAFPVQHIAAGEDCTAYRYTKPKAVNLTLTVNADDVRDLIADRLRSLHDGGVVPAHGPRFVKVNADGDRLSQDAKQWAGVLDTHHQLLWSADEVGGERMNHADAVKACAGLILCGGPARLPTRVELLTLVDDTRHEPAIALEFFPTCRSNYYWTSTPAAWSPSDLAWVVLFNYGHASSYHRGDDAFVRAVRSVGASPGQ